MNSRRKFLAGSAAGFFGATVVSRVGAASLPEAPMRATAEMAPPLFPKSGPQYNPVVTLKNTHQNGISTIPAIDPCHMSKRWCVVNW